MPPRDNKRIKAGDLIHLITLQSPQRTTNSIGETVVTGWNTGTTRWASVEAVTGSEFFLAEQVQAKTTYKLKFRYLAGVDGSWSALWGTRRFQFAEDPRDPVGDQEHLEVLAIEKTS